ncbi:Rod shape-determining protein MreD [Pediococcus acidilactici]|uniref:rod shape-determining protein MreD n=1 Tax=Pediococcus acidilactici TaxID=1254 RepID=UPI00097E9EEB|nr:rod shape-determining protein MreD [Pediococcus acidilactici]SJM44270.1 Rod shape-determining protein MreD [Pediococcus acidilactici]
MLQSAKLKYLFPIILFGTFFLDGALNQIFSAVLFQYPYSMICNLTLMWFVMGIFFEGESQINFTLWAFVIGIVFDWYYTGVFGVNTFIIPLVVMFVREVRLYVNTSFLIVMVLDTLAMALYNVLFYAVFQAIHLANVSASFFVGYSFFPTIILNLALFVVLYYPIKTFFRRTRGTNYRSFG